MPSPEARLLADFLLVPAILRDVVSPRDFADVFPRAHRGRPSVDELYRELHRLRERDIALVRRAIAEEVSRSHSLRRAYAHERRQADAANVPGLLPQHLRVDDEPVRSSLASRPHTLATACTALDKAAAALDAQVAALAARKTRALADVREAVGALSDLRQGRFAQSAGGETLGVEALAALHRLETACAPPAK